MSSERRDPTTVKVRILPAGADKVFTGEYDSLKHEFTKYPAGAVVDLAPEVVWPLEARGFVEILS